MQQFSRRTWSTIDEYIIFAVTSKFRIKTFSSADEHASVDWKTTKIFIFPHSFLLQLSLTCRLCVKRHAFASLWDREVEHGQPLLPHVLSLKISESMGNFITIRPTFRPDIDYSTSQDGLEGSSIPEA
jgi:hypothetical protein